MPNNKQMSDKNKQMSDIMLKFTYALLVSATVVLAVLKLTDVIYLPWVFILMPFIVSNIVILPLMKKGKI